jgi:hypothetical protein
LGQFVSLYFLIIKSNGQKRFILNLKKLNKLIIPPHFKIEGMRTVTKLVSRDAFMIKIGLTIDLIINLKDAYFLVPIRPNHQEIPSVCCER